MSAPDPWHHLVGLTPARIALGRAGPGLPTREVLRFALAHAKACDAVHAALDVPHLAGAIAALGLEAVPVASRAATRELYLRRPDLGRRLSPESSSALAGASGGFDLALVLADGLSARAVEGHAVPLLEAFLPHARSQGWRLAPVAVAIQARVALGDEIGHALGARSVAVLVGERPGLSAPDSLGVYLTFDPRPGRSDAERNCISNIRRGGLSYQEAAFRLAWLTREALRRQLTGVALKDESGGLPALAP